MICSLSFLRKLSKNRIFTIIFVKIAAILSAFLYFKGNSRPLIRFYSAKICRLIKFWGRFCGILRFAAPPVISSSRWTEAQKIEQLKSITDSQKPLRIKRKYSSLQTSRYFFLFFKDFFKNRSLKSTKKCNLYIRTESLEESQPAAKE